MYTLGVMLLILCGCVGPQDQELLLKPYNDLGCSR